MTIKVHFPKKVSFVSHTGAVVEYGPGEVRIPQTDASHWGLAMHGVKPVEEQVEPDQLPPLVPPPVPTKPSTIPPQFAGKRR